MPELLYYIETRDPSRHTLTPGERDALAHLTPADTVGGMVLCNRGDGPPNAADGILLFHRAQTGLEARHLINPSRMTWGTWGTICSTTRVLLGKWDDLPAPGPDDLARAQQIPGLAITLEDGNPWQIPTVLFETHQSALPGALSLDPSGQLISEPLRRYRRLAELGEESYALCRTLSRGEPADPVRIVHIAIQALGANYRLTSPEIALLQLLTEHTAIAILYALIGINIADRIRDQQKKKTTTTSPPSGPPASSNATPSPTIGSI